MPLLASTQRLELRARSPAARRGGRCRSRCAAGSSRRRPSEAPAGVLAIDISTSKTCAERRPSGCRRTGASAGRPRPRRGRVTSAASAAASPSADAFISASAYGPGDGRDLSHVASRASKLGLELAEQVGVRLGIDLAAQDLLGALDGERGDLLAQRLARLDRFLLGLGARGGDDLRAFLAGACSWLPRSSTAPGARHRPGAGRRRCAPRTAPSRPAGWRRRARPWPCRRPTGLRGSWRRARRARRRSAARPWTSS